MRSFIRTAFAYNAKQSRLVVKMAFRQGRIQTGWTGLKELLIKKIFYPVHPVHPV